MHYKIGKYYSALKRAINFLPFTQGGITRRPGLRFLATNFCDLGGRIIPFKFSRDVTSNFIVHLCDEQLFITNGVDAVDITGPPGPLALACSDPATGLTDCSIQCGVGVQQLIFTVSGGVPPYIFSILPSDPINPLPSASLPLGVPTATVVLTLTATAHTNPVGFAAYRYYVCDCDGILTGPSPTPLFCTDVPGGGICQYRYHHVPVECDGTFATPTDSCGGGHQVCQDCFPNCVNPPTCPPGFCGSPACIQVCQGCAAPTRTLSGLACTPPNHGCVPFAATRGGCGAIHDSRSPAAIAAGCAPCSLQFQSLVVTVTDNIGTMVSVTVFSGELPQSNQAVFPGIP